MADAMCGPSNALQNFKRHTQVDRSLQQDRLTGSRVPTESFRTQDPRAGSLDADFHAFENASASPFQEAFVGSSFSPQAHFQHPAAANWASDFQQLNISEQPLSAQHFRSYAPLVKSTNGGWHNEFARQQQAMPNAVSMGKQPLLDQQNASLHAPTPYSQSSLMPMSSFRPQMDAHQFSHASESRLSDREAVADWSQAFEEAFQDAFTDVDLKTKDATAQESSKLQEETSLPWETLAEAPQPEQIKIGSDAINYTEMKDRTADQESQDASALARVAGELLHSVQHDSSEKFQNSQFLDLMRKIRDRQVEVKNNDFEATNGEAKVDPLTSIHTAVPLSDQEIRDTPDPHQDRDTFAFPDMNTVFSPRQDDLVDYTFDDDQYPVHPRNQISELHPGGKYYPEQSPVGAHAQMSGAVSTGTISSNVIEAADFEAAYDENRGLASRYQRNAA